MGFPASILKNAEFGSLCRRSATGRLDGADYSNRSHATYPYFTHKNSSIACGSTLCVRQSEPRAAKASALCSKCNLISAVPPGLSKKQE